MKNIKRSSINPFLLKKNRAITLLEVLLGFTLILLCAGVIGWKSHAFFKKRRFLTDVKRLEARCMTLHRLAMNMQVDWEGIFQKEGDHWTFQAVCIDPSCPSKAAVLPLHISELYFDGESKQGLRLEFFSSGAVRPLGTLLFRNGKEIFQKWEIPQIFGLEEGGIKDLGPIHPDEA